jgi:phage protein D
MPGPLAIAAYQGGAAVARYVTKHGVKKAVEKYGKAALKKVATKKAAGNAAARTALVSGEGAAVKAVNNRRAKAKPGKKKMSESRANLTRVAEEKAHTASYRAAKQKADYERREAAKAKPAAKKKSSISVKKNKTPLATKIGKARDKIYKPVSRRT